MVGLSICSSSYNFLSLFQHKSSASMEAGRSLVSSPPQLPLKTHLRNCSSSSVLMLHEQVTPALTSPSTTSSARFSVTSVLIEDPRNDNILQQTLDKRHMVMGPTHLPHEEKSNADPVQDVNEFQHQLLRMLELWYLWPSLQKKENSFSMASEPISRKNENSTGLVADRVVELAKEAFSACKEAAAIPNGTEFFETHLDDSSSISVPVQITVRSTRHLERQIKRRKVPKPKVEDREINHRKKTEPHRKLDDRFDPNDPLRLFLRAPETTQLLTAKEEFDLIEKIQELMKLNEVKNRLETQFSREPTLVEWAEAIGTSRHDLQLQVHCGNNSRHRLIKANFRMVVHIAKQYQGRGLSLQDLLQAGSIGLMRSVDKFKPLAGCRFASYAYWWIKQSVRKAIFQHSRTIRLPENVYGLLSKVYEAEKLCIQQGNHYPRNEDIASCAGISVERLDKLLYSTRLPLSMQQPVWVDQKTTYQEITADASIEVPEVGVSKQLMRQHMRNLLSILNPRERKIIRLRFGIKDGKQKSVSEVAAGFGLSKERVRQLETRALYKLKRCISSQGLEAYADMLV